jgi:tetratricopeptide (TPR) repeat protein
METIYRNRVVPVCIGLDLDHLTLILHEAIPLFSIDSELMEIAQMQYMHLTAVCEEKEKLSEDDLDQIAIILETFVSSTKDLPPMVVAYAHTYIGLVRQHQERYPSAIDSLLKTLWVQTSAHEPADRIAVSSHRLGLAYGASSDFVQASSLLKKALQLYEEAHVPRYHQFVLSAKRGLAQFEARKEVKEALLQSKATPKI